jgi:hypothetical protein
MIVVSSAGGVARTVPASPGFGARVARAMQEYRGETNLLNLKLSPIGAATVVGLLLSGNSAAQAPAAAETPAVAEFNKGVAAYVDVHKKADGLVPSLRRTDDPAEISSRETALGDAIRALRASARPSDIMTRDIAREFRRLIKQNYRSRSREERKIFLEEIPNFHPKVNQTYPAAWPFATFPATLLDVLPKLPEILEYRLLSEALILRDVKANIVVDFILDVY